MNTSLTRVMYLLVAVFLAAAAIGSCTTYEYGDDDDGSGGSSTSSGTGGTQPTSDFTLTVDSAMTKDAIGPYTVTPGNQYVVLEITLANHSVPVALGTDLTYFSMTTAGSLVLSISTASGALSDVCRADLDVAQGGSVSCSLAFEAPVGDTPTELLYDDFTGHTPNAPIPPPVELTLCLGMETRMHAWENAPCAHCWEQDPCPNEMWDLNEADLPGGDCEADHVCWIDCGNNGGGMCACADQCLTTNTGVVDCRDLYDAVWACLVEHCLDTCT